MLQIRLLNAASPHFFLLSNVINKCLFCGTKFYEVQKRWRLSVGCEDEEAYYLWRKIITSCFLRPNYNTITEALFCHNSIS